MLLPEITVPPTTVPVLVIPTTEAPLLIATFNVFAERLKIVLPVIVCPPPLAWLLIPFKDGPANVGALMVRFRILTPALRLGLIKDNTELGFSPT